MKRKCPRKLKKKWRKQILKNLDSAGIKIDRLYWSKRMGWTVVRLKHET